MIIDSINNNNSNIYGVNNLKNKYQKSSTDAAQTSSTKADKFELSDEAKKIQQIKTRVENGFYDNPDILKEVALKLSREILKA